MAKRTIKINIKLPTGVIASSQLEAKATAAAKAVIDAESGAYVEALNLSRQLAAKGIQISAEELLKRKQKSTRKTAATAKGTAKKVVRKRVVLSDAKRKAMITEMKNGAKTAVLSKKYDVSTATVMNIKSAAGLTKKRK